MTQPTQTIDPSVALEDFVAALLAKPKTKTKNGKKNGKLSWNPSRKKPEETKALTPTEVVRNMYVRGKWRETHITILKCIDRCTCGATHVHCSPSVMLSREHPTHGNTKESISLQEWKLNHGDLPTKLETYEHTVNFCHECWQETLIETSKQMELNLNV